MKKLLALLILTTFLGCGSLDLYKDYGVVKGWGYKQMPPSQVTTSGATFYTIKLSDKSYSVGGLVTSGDGAYYYNGLMDDFGWYMGTDGDWKSYGGKRTKEGNLYFHLKKGVAIYFWAEADTYNVFKVTLNTPTEED